MQQLTFQCVAKEVFPLDCRVELHPATDRWMMGDRFGRVTAVNKTGDVRVKLDISGKSMWFHPDDVLHKGNRGATG